MEAKLAPQKGGQQLMCEGVASHKARMEQVQARVELKEAAWQVGEAGWMARAIRRMIVAGKRRLWWWLWWWLDWEWTRDAFFALIARPILGVIRRLGQCNHSIGRSV